MDSTKIAYSALQTSQRAIATTSHNIANANTEGYSRQRAELVAKPPERREGDFYGTGVFVDRVRRIADEFVNAQMREVGAEFGRLSVFQDFTQRIDNLLAEDDTSLGSAMQEFFNALEGVNVNPSSIPLRQEFLSRAENLVNRFHALDTRLRALTDEIGSRIKGRVDEINALSAGIAEMNRKIAVAASQTSGEPPNDLLDQRDRMVQQLAELTGARVVKAENHAINVLIGSGVSLVTGNHAEQLAALPDAFDRSKLVIALANNGTPIEISHLLGKGEIGGLLASYTEVIEPVRNELGQLAMAFGDAFNTQHRKGMDALGELGSDFFALGSAQGFARETNTGAAIPVATITDTRQLTSADYQLDWDGTIYTLTRLSDMATVSGPGPLTMDGVQFGTTGAVAAGDSFRFRPVASAARGIEVLVRNTDRIALASPLRTEALTNNVGSAKLGRPDITDASHANLLDTVEFRFITAGTFDVIDTTTNTTLNGAPLTYTSGMTVGYQGWQVSLSGTPAAGDTLRLSRNTSGIGDNTNGTALADLQNALIVEGRATFSADYGSLISRVGNLTRQTDISFTAQEAVLRQTQDRRDSVSGVNLDEEAINLTRYQQTYNAAAQVIATSNSLFDSILSIFR